MGGPPYMGGYLNHGGPGWLAMKHKSSVRLGNFTRFQGSSLDGGPVFNVGTCHNYKPYITWVFMGKLSPRIPNENTIAKYHGGWGTRTWTGYTRPCPLKILVSSLMALICIQILLLQANVIWQIPDASWVGSIQLKIDGHFTLPEKALEIDLWKMKWSYFQGQTGCEFQGG